MWTLLFYTNLISSFLPKPTAIILNVSTVGLQLPFSIRLISLLFDEKRVHICELFCFYVFVLSSSAFNSSFSLYARKPAITPHVTAITAGMRNDTRKRISEPVTMLSIESSARKLVIASTWRCPSNLRIKHPFTAADITKRYMSFFFSLCKSFSSNATNCFAREYQQNLEV